MRYFLHLAYNGGPFNGWQIQPNAPSVQEVLEKAFSIFCKESINIVGCGRTDAGVHALNFYAHFDTEQVFDSQQLDYILRKVNAFLDENVAVYRIFPVREDLHARFSAVSRTYRYHVSASKQPFRQEFSHRIFFNPDMDMMNEAAAKLFNYTDFTSFSKLHTQTATNDCRIMQAHWDKVDDEFVFTIQANRFLRNMVRAITGTLLDVGRGKLTVSQFCDIIERKDRCAAGTSMPAKALFLADVEYDFGTIQF